MSQGISSLSMSLHLVTLFLIYAYVKEELVFSFMWVLLPSIIVFAAQVYHLIKTHHGVRRAKYLISFTLLICCFLALSKVVKNQGGIQGKGIDDHKWLVKHRKAFLLLAFSMITFIYYSMVDYRHKGTNSVVKEVLLNVFSSLSMPLSICSGGACNSIYISTITSILSSFSVPLTLVVPILNYLAYILQLVGLFSIYSVNKWRSLAFWLYIVGMIVQIFIVSWLGCILMIISVVINAKFNQFVYGKKKLFKETIL